MDRILRVFTEKVFHISGSDMLTGSNAMSAQII